MNSYCFPSDGARYYEMASKAVNTILYSKGFNTFFRSDEREDLVSDVVTRMLTSGTYDPSKGTLEQWVYVIARNLVYSEAKKKQRWNSVFTNISDSESDDDNAFEAFGASHADDYGTDCQLLAEETREACFASLRSEQDKQLLQLKLDGYPIDEIAERMGLTPKQVHMRTFRLRRRLHDAA